MVVASVDILMFSVDTDHVLVEGGIMMFFGGLVDFSETIRIIESC